MNQRSLEQQLAQVFGYGLSTAIAILLVGVVVRPVLWLGIGALMLVPLAGAVVVWREEKTTTATRVNILMAFSGVVLAAVAGLLLRK